MAHLTARIAEYVAEWQPGNVPPDARAIIKRAVLDGIGVGLLGSTRPMAAILAKFAAVEGAPGTCSAIASEARYSPGFAAFYNAALVHAEDFDDMGPSGHPTVAILPAVLAAAEDLDATGEQLMAAYAIGYQLTAVLWRALQIDRPFHPTNVIGSVSGAAACSWLRHLAAPDIAIAMGIGASHSGGLRRNFGTFTKPLHAGRAAQAGVVAAELAQLGWTADPAIIESPHGFADCFGGENCNLAAVDFSLTQLSWLLETPPEPKPWPVCAGTNGALIATFDLLSRASFDVAEIESLQIVQPRAPQADASFRMRPTTPLEAKFSVPFVVAAALRDRKIDVATFTPEGFAAVMSSGLPDKVRVTVDPEAQFWSARVRTARPHRTAAAVILRDGRRFTGEYQGPFPGAGLSTAASREKFLANARPVLGESGANHVVEQVERLEEVRVRELMASIAFRKVPG